MWISYKYCVFLLVIIVCILTIIECKEKEKEKVKRKSNTTQKPKKINTTAKKLINTKKNLVSTTTARPVKSNKIKRSDPKPTKRSLLGSKVSKNSLHKSAKQTTVPSKPVFNFESGLTEQQREKAVEVVTEVFENTNKNNSELVECIRRELDKELGLRSNVILSSNPFMEQSISRIAGTIAMQFSTVMPRDDSQVLVSIFGSMRGNQLMERTANLMRNAQKLSPKIVDSLMSPEMKQEIQKLSTRVVRNANSIEELSDQLSEVMNDKFGPHWHAVVGHKNMMSVDNHRKSSVFFLDMDFGDMRVSIFK